MLWLHAFRPFRLDLQTLIWLLTMLNVYIEKQKVKTGNI